MRGDGDADLFVQFYSPPPLDSYADCAPLLVDSYETCTLTVPAGGAEAFIAVGGARASFYTMSIRYTPGF